MKKTLTLLMAAAAVMSAYPQSIDRLQKILDRANAQCPLTVTDGSVMRGVTLETPNIVYTYTLDPGYVDFAEIKEKSDLLHDSKVMEISTDTSDDALAPYCLANGLNIVYKFYCAGDSTQVVITPEDLK